MADIQIYGFDEVFEKEVKAINTRRRALGRTDEVTLATEADTASAPSTKPNSKQGSQANPLSSSESTTPERENARPQREPVLRPTNSSNLVGLALSGGGVRSASFCLGALQALDKADVLKNIDYLSTVSGGGYIGTSLSAAMTHSKGKFPFKSSLGKDEPFPLQHIRNHSNYLFPRGSINFFYNGSIFLRGLLANALLILPWLLLAAAVTIFFKPTSDSLHVARVGYFGITLIALCVLGGVLLAWGLWRSLDITGWHAEIGSRWTRLSAGLFLLLLVLGFCELQPVILAGIFKSTTNHKGFLVSFVDWLKGLAAVLAPFSAAVAFFGRYIAGLMKQGNKAGFGAIVLHAASRVAVYVAGAAIPFLLWMAYLYLSFGGIKDAGMKAADSSPYHAPRWVIEFSQSWFGHDTPIARFYLVMFFFLLSASLLLNANANSLHRLYRDRLSKAFLFDPTNPDENFELAPLDHFKLSQLSCTDTPYHIINAALNIQGSTYANRRGRNADFFIFSPKSIGSRATGYVLTGKFEEQIGEFDLATAMAISGAAASSNMGAKSIRPLTPTLAILNIRLGYWVVNPGQLAQDRKRLFSLFHGLFDQLYFLHELLGLMREDSQIIYLTDGGHIDNLGIYELLRRRCRLIVAVDAEADPEMSFPSLVALQRYASIDLGITILLPRAEIRDKTRAASEEIAKSGGLAPHNASHGPHCAIGEIIYTQDRRGVLLYIKSSITGDENDYIVDYKRRFPSYPHESTADQVFSEEQFEVYRALGFHVVTELFSGRDHVGMCPTPKQWRGLALNDPLVKIVKSLLKWRMNDTDFSGG
jgi:predicted acylesterase/phospholipase RssA